MPTPPACVTDPHPTAALQRMSAEDRATYRAAAGRATRLYPGPVGELVHRELLTFVEFGWRLPSDSLLTRLRDDILRQRSLRTDRVSPEGGVSPNGRQTQPGNP